MTHAFVPPGINLRYRLGSYIRNHPPTATPWLLVRKRTIPTERPPLVDEI
jgi:hypothetical protein